MKENFKKRKSIIIFYLFGILTFLTILTIKFYTRPKQNFTFDAAYYWTNNQYQDKLWLYEELPSGHKYHLYVPEKFKNNKNCEQAKLPLIVVFHGSDEKGKALSKYGRIFLDKKFQSKINPNGAAVLVILSRINYFTDPASTSLLIQNICLKNKCIDKSNIIGYGFSQGAKFVVELACHDPSLFRGVASGSGFYQIKLKELLKVLPIQFYSAISKNDKGIYEQGHKTGKLCSFFCKNSRYVEYENRWHFWIELNDKTGKKNKNGSEETFLDWIVKVAQ